MSGDTIDSALDYLRSTVNDPDIEVQLLHGMNPSAVSRTDSKGWEKLCTAIGQIWSDAIISPYLMLQCSDSRHFCRISDKVMRFSAMELTKEERATIHANDERVPVEKAVKAAEFFARLMMQL